MARRAEGAMRDALDLGAAVGAEVGSGMRFGRALTEVDPAGKLAHDEDVGVLRYVGTQRRHLLEAGKDLRGAEVGEQAELFADAQQTGFRPDLSVIPLVTADRPEKHGVRIAASLEGFVRQWIAVPVDRDPAKVMFGEGQPKLALVRQ